MNTMKSICSLGVGLVMLSGCSPDNDLVEEDIDSVGQAVTIPAICTDNNMGKWQHLANLAVATAEEMGELNTTEQFTVGTVAGPYGDISAVTLSAYGAAVCAAKGGCPMVQGLLDLQAIENDVLVPQADFNVIDYNQTLITSYYNQVNQINSYVNNSHYELLPEDHKTTLLGQDGTATCGTPWYSFEVTRDFHFQFSSSGPVADMNCTQLTEPGDVNGWDNNYLCSERNVGLEWSNSGPISGMTCVNFADSADPDGWSDNYLCTPENWGLEFSSSGAISGKSCVAINEPNDAAWSDNYLCWDGAANLNHPATLCQEFGLFGGATACGGSNPYIDFVTSSDLTKFKIDPTDYTSGSSASDNLGGCVTSLPYVSISNATGRCCYARSTNRWGYLKRYPLSLYVYYCYTG